ncbi:ABC transporter permease [Rhizobium hainanense]|uniref:Peptide/nickel transport system permease protein n=1 Tax=Rhizobium hainanense TaxID=52131 RepID=A0A1C3W8R8_9HYPH|nr:ABC transporter permease [Rhizobium hainanense]SCB36542.1 peptide/nickel transport system permease protein [Rhizobium hainanense]
MWIRRLTWLSRRLCLSLFLLIVVSILIFAVTQALPGDVATMILGTDATPEKVSVLRREMHLDEPILLQYFSWVSGIIAGNFGYSHTAGIPVAQLTLPRIFNTFVVVTLSMCAALPVSMVLGLLTALYKDTWFDRVILGLSLSVNALPEFVLALVLVMLLSTTVFHLFPALSIPVPDQPMVTQLDILLLPCLTLFLLQMTYLYRLVRAAVIDVLAADYIQFAMLKGLSTGRILFRHALPNAAIPALQAAATVFAVCIGGVVVIEYVFAFPGMGTALTDAVGNRDLAVVQFIVLIIASTFIVANIVADVITAFLKPPARGDAL